MFKRSNLTNTVGLAKPAALLAMVSLSSMASADVIYQTDFESWNGDESFWSHTDRGSLGGPYTTVLSRFGADTVSLNILATEQNSGGFGGGEPGDDSIPFNLTLDWFDDDRQRIPYLDQGGGGGGQHDPFGGGAPDVPKVNLGGTVFDGTNPGNDGPPMFSAGTYAITFDLMAFDSWDGVGSAWGPDTVGLDVNGQNVFSEVFGYSTEWDFRAPDEYPTENAYNHRHVDVIYRDVEVQFDLTEASEALIFDFIGGTNQEITDESWGLDNVRVEQLAVLRSEAVPVPGTLAIIGGGLGLMSRRRR
jgi:hypothetical protein